MTTTPTALTAQQQAVIDAAKAWAEKLPASHEEALFPAERAILDAVRALDPPAPVLPPIPEPGPYLDKGGAFCWIDDEGRVRELGSEDDTSWDIAHRYGPFTRLVPATDAYEHHDAQGGVATCDEVQRAVAVMGSLLREADQRPATDVVDAGIVRRLADALRTHALAKHIDHKASFGEARFDDCTAPSCREISALLVLAEGATGGGR